LDRHIGLANVFPEQLHGAENSTNTLTEMEEFKILLATIQSGKELGIVKDTGQLFTLIFLYPP
jgi:hypothetical protein